MGSRAFVERGCEHAPSGLSELLGLIERQVSMLQHGAGIFRVRIEHPDTYRRGAIGGRPPQVIGLAQAFGYLVEKEFEVAHRRTLNDHGELVTTDPRHHVMIAAQFVQATGDMLQELITRRMAQRIVHPFEVIQIEPNQRSLDCFNIRFAERLFQSLLHVHPVWQTRQPVIMRHKGNTIFYFLGLGDVRCYPAEASELAIIEDWLPGKGQPAFGL